MNYEKIQISRYAELVKLPWFEMGGDGQLQLKKDSGVPPIIDMHTHLGWSYFGGRVVDYQKRVPEAVHYYDYVNAIVDLMKNEHPTKAEANSIMWDVLLVPFRCAPRAKTQTAANLLADMERFNTVASVVLPIEIPVRSRHAYQCAVNCKPHDGLIFFAGVHPSTRYKKLRLDWQVEQGAIGLKFHPEFQFCPPDTKGALELFGICAERGLPVLGHSGSTGSEPQWMQRMSAPDRYRKALELHPNLKLVLGHTGIIHYEQAIKIASDFPEQVYLETSGQGIPVIRKILDETDPKRVVYGSDWSFFPLGVPIARSMAALDGYPREVVEGYFYKNAARLLGLDEAEIEKGKVVKK